MRPDRPFPGGGRVLVVGAGGLGCPAMLALAHAYATAGASFGLRALALCDDDVVDRTNLHRQILFGEADVGQPKLAAAARALRQRAPGLPLTLHETRILPHNARSLVAGADLVLEGSDNFATKFLVADACALAGVPVVHASAVRWVGTALAVSAGGRPCYRCLFEDLPEGEAPNCADAGVMGPVVGVVAAAQVDLALAWLAGRDVGGTLVTFDGRAGRDGALRRRTVPRRADCPLCGPAPRIRTLDPSTYLAQADCA